ncbi:S-adenosyl-L-methionine-dependent methyltransferase [Dentipellis sp. KUC8613]|nr:S-adenosyl-L-methionine-dependent methyltransferase [Dentipellis sp. KUC8613]
MPSSTVTAKERKIADLRALVSLISSATESAIASYEAYQGEVPALDELGNDGLGPTDLHKHLRVLESATTQLCTTLTPPTLTIFSKALAGFEVACMRVAIRAKIPDILLAHPEGLHVDAIAEKAGLEPKKLARILRCLAARHTFLEVSHDVFTNSRTSYTLRSECPIADYAGMMAEEFQRNATANLYDALTDPVYGPSYDANRSAFSYGVKDELKDVALFTWYEHHPELRQRFSRAMTSDRYGRIFDFYPVESLPAGTTWCDVGGGYGHIWLEMSRRHPQFHYVLQDMPKVITLAKPFWEEMNGEAVQQKRIDFVPINFLTESPVSGADFYYMRHIIHDWPNHDSITILQNVRKAMKPTSRLLIHEFILPSLEGGGLADAPKPLMPMYGAGNARPFLQDINMMSSLNSQERPLTQFIELGNKAGLEFVKLWEGIENSAVEFKVAQQMQRAAGETRHA